MRQKPAADSNWCSIKLIEGKDGNIGKSREWICL